MIGIERARMAKEYVEQRPEGFIVTGTGASLASVVLHFQQGSSPEYGCWPRVRLAMMRLRAELPRTALETAGGWRLRVPFVSPMTDSVSQLERRARLDERKTTRSARILRGPALERLLSKPGRQTSLRAAVSAPLGRVSA
jgi:hypothetical protein